MNAAQLLTKWKNGNAPPAILLLGPEAYERRRIKQAMMAGASQDAVAQHDLMEIDLAEALDDARSLSLFASERLIWMVNAEAALPRGKAAVEEDEDGEGGSGSGDAAVLADYMKDPTPGVTLVFEACRFDFEGDDKRKLDRVRKFYSAIPDVVEMRRFESHQARTEAQALLRRAQFENQRRSAGVAAGGVRRATWRGSQRKLRS